MKKLYFITTILTLATLAAHAQAVLTGTVTEVGRNIKLENVFIRDINTKQVALTDKDGNFDIRTMQGHTLIFSLSGFVADTLYLVDLKPKHVELRLGGINLRVVNIRSTAAVFNPRLEYPDIYEKSKFALSPSRLFGKESRDARRLKRYFENEVKQRQIDAVFNRAYVSSVVPLKGLDLENFMTMYRPSFDFVKNSSPQTLTLYINDSYRKFMALPADKRSIAKLSGD